MRARSTAAVLAAVLGMVFPAESWAQSASDPVAARALFQSGRHLAAEGRYDLACPAFEESQALDPGIGTLFNWADCLEHLGKTASAWVRFLDAAGAAKTAGQGEREKVARERAAALESKLSTLMVAVADADPGLEVSRDGTPLGRVLWGRRIPIDPGIHTISARAPGKQDWQRSVRVGGDGAQAVVDVPPLEATPAPEADASAPVEEPSSTAPAPRAAVVPASAARPSPAPADAESALLGWRRSQQTMAFVAGGLGVAGLVVGAVFAADTASKNSAARAICADHPDACDQPGIDEHERLASEAETAKTVSIVSFVVAGMALAGGAVLWATLPSPGNAARPGRSSGRAEGAAPACAVRPGLVHDWHVQAWMDHRMAGIGLGGRW